MKIKILTSKEQFKLADYDRLEREKETYELLVKNLSEARERAQMSAEHRTIRSRKKFYDSGEWQRIREKVLKRDNYECQWCKLEGKLTTSEPKQTLAEYFGNSPFVDWK